MNRRTFIKAAPVALAAAGALCHTLFKLKRPNTSNCRALYDLYVNELNKGKEDGSAQHPFRTITAAMDYASNLTGEDRVTIRVDPGAYAFDGFSTPEHDGIDIMGNHRKWPMMIVDRECSLQIT